MEGATAAAIVVTENATGAGVLLGGTGVLVALGGTDVAVGTFVGAFVGAFDGDLDGEGLGVPEMSGVGEAVVAGVGVGVGVTSGLPRPTAKDPNAITASTAIVAAEITAVRLLPVRFSNIGGSIL